MMTVKLNYLVGLSFLTTSTFLFCPSAYAESQLKGKTAGQPSSELKAHSKKVATKSNRRSKKPDDRGSARELLEIDTEALEIKHSDSSKNKNQPLQGELKYVDLSAGFRQGTGELTMSALQQQPKYLEAAKAVKHYRTRLQRSIRFAKDAINYAVPYRGFSMSIEGSRVLLNKDQKVNNLFIAELTQQKYIDEMHPQITARIMQIAVGLGVKDPDVSQREVENGVSGLEKLVGKDEAQFVKDSLVAWYDQLNVSDSAFQPQPWDVDTSARIYQKALDTAADGDPLIDDICKRVEKYIRSKLASLSAGAIESTLSAMTVLSGNPLASLSAEGANTAFVMRTGGPEENKILKDLYFGRRMEIRRKRLTDEVQLALTNYEKAHFTHNKAQLAISEIVLGQLVGPERLADVLERDPVTDIESTAPIELAKVKDSK